MKKAQTTLYMIISVIIVLIVVILITIKPSDPDETLSIPKVPSKLEPINTFVEQCMFDISSQALKKVKEQGGYIYTEDLFIDRINPTEGNSIEMVPNSNFKIPLWYHMSSPNDCKVNCQFKSERLPLIGENSVETQIERYIDENLPSCISNFKSFEELGFEVNQLSSPKSDVMVREKSLLVKLDLPLLINYEGSENQINLFIKDVHSVLFELYEAASEISEYQTNNCFVDEHMINIISYHGGLGKDIPPFTGASADISELIWIKPSVKDKINYLTQSYIPLIRLGNTYTIPYPEINEGVAVSLAKGINDQFVFYPFSKFREVRPSFYYFPWWEPYFDVLQSNGPIIGPSDTDDYSGNLIADLIGGLIFRQYDYSYLYSFPVVVELRAFDDNGYEKLFRFALESNIRSNKCFYPEGGITIEDSTDSLLCDELFKSDDVSIKVVDKLTNKDLENVSLYFHAGSTCLLGKTNSDGMFIDGIPVSDGGFLKFQRDGYLSQFLHDSEFSFPMRIELLPIKEFDINLSIFSQNDYFRLKGSGDALGLRSSVLKNPSPNDTILVVLNRLQESYKDPEYVKSITLSDEEIFPEKLELVEGTYELEIYLFNMTSILIGEELDRVCAQGAGLYSSCVKTPVDPNCNTRGTPINDFKQKEWQNSDCYKQGYSCESVSSAYVKGSDYLDNDKIDKCGFPRLSGRERLRIQEEDPARWESIMLSHTAYLTLNAIMAPYCEIKECEDEENSEILLNETLVDSFPQGGALFNETNNYWTINYNMMDDMEAVQFFIVRHPVPTRHHHLNDLLLFMDYSMETPYLFRPRFI